MDWSDCNFSCILQSFPDGFLSKKKRDLTGSKKLNTNWPYSCPGVRNSCIQISLDHVTDTKIAASQTSQETSQKREKLAKPAKPARSFRSATSATLAKLSRPGRVASVSI